MKIAVWSSYNHGNFGDDLMAVQFATAIKKRGATPVVYRLDQRTAGAFGIKTVFHMDELMDGVAAVVIGGGALFTRESLLRLLLRKTTIDFERDFKELYQAVVKANCPVYPLSIGGDGGGVAAGIPRWHQMVFRHPLCNKGTVRLPDCLNIAQEFGIDAVYLPDVVFAADYCFNPPQEKFGDGKIHIGVNLKKTDTALIQIISDLAAGHGARFVFHFIKTHLSGYRADYEYLPPHETDNIKAHRYEDLNRTIAFFSSLDLLITVKLHIGITALSKGVPMISFNGKAKTQTMLKSIAAAKWIWSTDQLREIPDFFSRLEIEQINSFYDFNQVEIVKRQSLGHLDFMRRNIVTS